MVSDSKPNLLIAGMSRLAVALTLTTCIAGCRLFTSEADTAGRSPLKPPRPSTDSVSLEIFWARYPWGDVQLNDTVWGKIDESQLSPSLRRELAANGLRAGIVGALVPDAIAEALHLETTTSTKVQPPNAAEALADLLTEPAVRRRRRQLRAGQRLEMLASDLFAEIPLFWVQNGELRGHTYTDAQAMYALEVEPQADRVVKLMLTPELHHGPLQTGYTGGGDGIIRPVQMREREVFAHLRLEVQLAAGEMLVITGSPESSCRLGHCFHATQGAEGRQQKLVVIRLAQVPDGDAFAMRNSTWPSWAPTLR